MYTRKSDLICRLVRITGDSRACFTTKTVVELDALLGCYNSNEKRTYLEVSYKQKEIVHLLSAKYDGVKKKWYIPFGVKTELFRFSNFYYHHLL